MDSNGIRHRHCAIGCGITGFSSLPLLPLGRVGHVDREQARLAHSDAREQEQRPTIRTADLAQHPRRPEVQVPEQAEPRWGDQKLRGIHWELATAWPLIEAGAEVVILRHPESLRRIRRMLDAWFAPSTEGNPWG